MNETRLFELRENADLLQKDISNELGVTQQTYSLWEKGTKIISLKYLNCLCNFHNVSMDYILKLSNNPKNETIFLKELDKVEIGKRIRMIREENNLTLRALADELNTTSSTISAYETGKVLILTAFAYQICLKYGKSMDWLCGKTKSSEIK